MISVVIPLYNEQENIEPLQNEVATALSGLWAGEVLRGEPTAARRVRRMVGAALSALLATWLLERWIPVNKNLWSSSFVTLTTAMSLGLLALFHVLIDVRGWERASWPLRAIGANALGAYLLWRFVDFHAAALQVVGDSPAPGVRAAAACLAFLLLWLLLAGLYHRRWFLRL